MVILNKDNIVKNLRVASGILNDQQLFFNSNSKDREAFAIMALETLSIAKIVIVSMPDDWTTSFNRSVVDYDIYKVCTRKTLTLTTKALRKYAQTMNEKDIIPQFIDRLKSLEKIMGEVLSPKFKITIE